MTSKHSQPCSNTEDRKPVPALEAMALDHCVFYSIVTHVRAISLEFL